MLSAHISNQTRKAVYRRDGYRCALCDDTRGLQVHHVVRRSQGGTDYAHNLITLCWKCHAAAHGTAPLAAVLWGKPAQKYAPIFNRAAAHRPVLVLESAHPSPLSAYRGFFGSAPFGKVNEFLKNNDAAKIDWCLPANATHS